MSGIAGPRVVDSIVPSACLIERGHINVPRENNGRFVLLNQLIEIPVTAVAFAGSRHPALVGRIMVKPHPFGLGHPAVFLQHLGHIVTRPRSIPSGTHGKTRDRQLGRFAS